LGLAIASVAIILIFSVGAIGKFDSSLLFNILPEADQANWLPKGFGGIFNALPYAIWLYLGIEVVPLAAEEAQDGKDVSKAMLRGMYVLIPLSILILVLNTGLPIMGEGNTIGAIAVAASNEPFNDGLAIIFGNGFLNQVMRLSVLFILLAGFPACIYASSRLFFALSRAGFFPRWISVTNGSGMPARAAILSSAIVFLLTLGSQFFTKNNQAIDTAFVNMAVASAVISYGLVMCSYIKLKISRPNLLRPYVSPVGIPGAIVGVVLSVVAFISCFANPDYRNSVYLVVGVFAIASGYFWIYSRNQLVADTDELMEEPV
jgi:ethanolamine permease